MDLSIGKNMLSLIVCSTLFCKQHLQNNVGDYVDSWISASLKGEQFMNVKVVCSYYMFIFRCGVLGTLQYNASHAVP